MKEINKEYYFSKIAWIIGAILILVFTFIMSYLSYTTYFEPSPYNDKKFLAIMFLLALILMLVAAARRSYTIIYSIAKNRPALILTKESLTDVLNRKTIKWTDINEIKDKFHFTGKYSRNYITVSLRGSDKKIRIEDGAIKCKKKDLHRTLIKYHQKYK